MGNSQSSSQHHRRFSASPRPVRSSNGSPAPGQPHRSMRQKKKSLELPDLAMLGITPTSVYEQNQKSSAIPIPISVYGGRQPKEKEVYAVQPSDYIEKNLGKQAQQQHHHQQPQVDPNSRGRAKHTQVPLNYSFATASEHLAPNAPPPSRELSPSTAPSRTPSVVKTSLPLVLPKALEPVVPEIPTLVEEAAENDNIPQNTGPLKELQEVVGRDSTEEIMVKISWHGGGNEVFLARAGDDDWKGRRKMEREGPTSTTFSTVIPLLPGTHHLRFQVDDRWRVAEDLPTAVDDQGSLANYVAVGTAITGVVTTPGKTSGPTHRTVNSNAAAGLKLTGVDDPSTLEGLRRYHSFWSTSSIIDGDEDIQPPQQPNSPKTIPSVGSPTKRKMGTYSRYTPRWTNEIPLELIEAAGEEEAYLNYQTQLQQQMYSQQQYGYGHPNSRVPVQISGFVPLPNIPPAPSLPRYLDKLILNAHMQAKTGVGVSIGSTLTGSAGSPSSSSSSRGGRERVRSPTRDREREREAANRDRDRDRDREARRRERERERERRSLGMTSEEAMNISSTPTLPVTTASGTEVSLEDLSRTLIASGSTGSGSGLAGVGSGSVSPNLTGASNPNQNQNQKVDDTVVADDNSVLPVPSHVVLNHLCTSAIRNGVLAVAETVRYRQKYVTTVYYKPAA